MDKLYVIVITCAVSYELTVHTFLNRTIAQCMADDMQQHIPDLYQEVSLCVYNDQGELEEL